MNKQTRKETKNTKRKLSPVTAGVAGAAVGAAVGAGVAVAATAAMKDKKTRAKVDRVLETVKKQATDYVDTMRNENLNEGKKTLGKIVRTAGQKLNVKSKNKRVASKSRSTDAARSAKSPAKASSHA